MRRGATMRILGSLLTATPEECKILLFEEPVVSLPFFILRLVFLKSEFFLYPLKSVYIEKIKLIRITIIFKTISACKEEILCWVLKYLEC